MDTTLDTTPGDGGAADTTADVATDLAQDLGSSGGGVAAVPSNAPVDVLIVLDRSGSMGERIDGTSCAMTDGCGAESKWTLLTTAFATFLPEVDSQVNWGLKLFGSAANGCSLTSGVEVPPGPMNAAKVNLQIAATTIGTSTPTTAAISAASAYLQTVADGAQKVILLATDGLPTCGIDVCTSGNTTANQCDDANAIAAVKRAHDELGIPTFVVGIGTDASPGDQTLSAMAIAGGYPSAGTPTYHLVRSGDDLMKALSDITASAGRCFFTLDPAIDPETTRISGVQADGMAIPSFTYTLAGANAIQLIGQVCADYLDGKIKMISAVTVREPSP